MNSPAHTDHPSVRRTRVLALRAAVDLLVEHGAEAVTHQRVAEAAGLGRATMYRHWSTPEELLFDALGQVATRFELAGTAPLRIELLAEIERNLESVNEPFVKVAIITVVQRAVSDAAAVELRDRLIANLAGSIRHSVAAAIRRGELREGMDADLLVTKVIGTLMYRRFFEDRPVDMEFVILIVDDALSPWEM